jgi:hypothetical protein
MDGKKMSRKFEVVYDTFDPNSGPTYHSLEVLSMEDLLTVATKHQDEEVIEELARRGLDFRKMASDAADEADRIMFGTRVKEKDE